jgi:hypothetical protein
MSTKRTIGFRLPWTDPSQVGTYITAPGSFWDGTPWVVTPPILGFEPDTEAAAQYVNALHKQHDDTDLAIIADGVNRDFCSAVLKGNPVAFVTRKAVWNASTKEWIIGGQDTTAGLKKVFSLNTANNNNYNFVDITPGGGLVTANGSFWGLAVPDDVNDVIATQPGGANTRLLAAVSLQPGLPPELYQASYPAGTWLNSPISVAASGAGAFTAADCSIIGGRGFTALVSYAVSRADGSFHIFDAAPGVGTPTLNTTSFAAATVDPVSRIRYLRSPATGEGFGDVDCIFELGQFRAGNLHKVFTRRYSGGSLLWTQRNEPFAATMDTSGGAQSTVLGAAYDRRYEAIVVAIWRYDTSGKGVWFALFDPQNGTAQDLGLQTAVWDNLAYRETISVNGASGPVYPVDFQIYNDAWVILLGGTGAAVQAIYSFDRGDTWHGEPGAQISGAAAYNPTPGAALPSLAPEFYSGERGFVFVPNQTVAIAATIGAFVVSPSGGGRTGRMT